MRERYAQHYRALWERHWWWRSRESWLTGWIERLAGSSRNLHILDAGCGDGLYFDVLSRFGEVEGLEPDERLLTEGPRRRAIRVGPLDATFRPERPYNLI